MRAGAVDFIDKPIVHPLLLNRVRQLLSTRT
jgi:FixJ family two-component response regulator